MPRRRDKKRGRLRVGKKRDTSCLFHPGQTWGHLIMPPSVQAGYRDARSALPFKWTLLPWELIDVLPKRLLSERVRRRF